MNPKIKFLTHSTTTWKILFFKKYYNVTNKSPSNILILLETIKKGLLAVAIMTKKALEIDIREESEING